MRSVAGRVSSPMFVGRGRELGSAAAALAAARHGQPALVLVAGEAGVGKTRFVQEVATRARASGHRVLLGGCVQIGDEGLPYGALIEALRGLARDVPPAELNVLLGSGQRVELRVRLSEQARFAGISEEGHRRLRAGENDAFESPQPLDGVIHRIGNAVDRHASCAAFHTRVERLS